MAASGARRGATGRRRRGAVAVLGLLLRAVRGPDPVPPLLVGPRAQPAAGGRGPPRAGLPLAPGRVARQRVGGDPAGRPPGGAGRLLGCRRHRGGAGDLPGAPQVDPRRPVVVAPVPSGIPVPEDPTGPTGGGADAPSGWACSATRPPWRPSSSGRWPACAGSIPRPSCGSSAPPAPTRRRPASGDAGRPNSVSDRRSTSPAWRRPRCWPSRSCRASSACSTTTWARRRGKSSLAALLACGRPVVAVDGPKTWRELADQHAVRLVADQIGLADALVELAGDRAGFGRRWGACPSVLRPPPGPGTGRPEHRRIPRRAGGGRRLNCYLRRVPRVSVILTTCDRPEWLAETRQRPGPDLRDTEIIVSDDASDERTAAVVAAATGGPPGPPPAQRAPTRAAAHVPRWSGGGDR